MEAGDPVTLHWCYKAMNEHLGSIECGDNMAHWQLSGTQEDGIVHGSKIADI